MRRGKLARIVGAKGEGERCGGSGVGLRRRCKGSGGGGSRTNGGGGSGTGARGGGGVGGERGGGTYSCGGGSDISDGGGGGRSPFPIFLEQPLEREFTHFFLQMTNRVCGGSLPLL